MRDQVLAIPQKIFETVAVFRAFGYDARVAKQPFLIGSMTYFLLFNSVFHFTAPASARLVLQATALARAETCDRRTAQTPSRAIRVAPPMVADGRGRLPTTWVRRFPGLHHGIRCARIRAQRRLPRHVSARVPRVPSTRKMCADSSDHRSPGRLSGHDHARRYHVPTVRAR